MVNEEEEDNSPEKCKERRRKRILKRRQLANGQKRTSRRRDYERVARKTNCCCLKRRLPWTPKEDAILMNYIETHGTPCNWTAPPQQSGLSRCNNCCFSRCLELKPFINTRGRSTTKESCQPDDDLISSSRHLSASYSPLGKTSRGNKCSDTPAARNSNLDFWINVYNGTLQSPLCEHSSKHHSKDIGDTSSSLDREWGFIYNNVNAQLIGKKNGKASSLVNYSSSDCLSEVLSAVSAALSLSSEDSGEAPPSKQPGDSRTQVDKRNESETITMNHSQKLEEKQDNPSQPLLSLDSQMNLIESNGNVRMLTVGNKAETQSEPPFCCSETREEKLQEPAQGMLFSSENAAYQFTGTMRNELDLT